MRRYDVKRSEFCPTFDITLQERSGRSRPETLQGEGRKQEFGDEAKHHTLETNDERECRQLGVLKVGGGEGEGGRFNRQGDEASTVDPTFHTIEEKGE